MSQDAWDVHATEPELELVPVRLLGTGASAPTRQYGRDITVARTGVGVYTLTFRETPGTFVGGQVALQGATPGNLKNVSVVFNTWNATTRVLEITVWSGAGAARELAATELLLLVLFFQPRAAGI